MNGKEEKWCSAFRALAALWGGASLTLAGVLDGALGAEEGREKIHASAEDIRRAADELHEKAARAFEGKPAMETARRLADCGDRVYPALDDAADLLSLCTIEEDEPLRTLGALAGEALRELAKLAAYDAADRGEAMKAAARALKIRNYETRGSACFYECMKALAENGSGCPWVKLELARRLRDVLRLAASCAALYEDMAQDLR